MKIISGGQTGVDRAALDVALEIGLPCGGWCPKGRKAEDGPLDPKYPLKETETADYAVRTEWNVRDSDGTLIITRGKPTGGTAFTIAMARVYDKPLMVINLDKRGQATFLEKSSLSPFSVEGVQLWLLQHKVQILNVAGPRESGMPGIYEVSKRLLATFLGLRR